MSNQDPDQGQARNQDRHVPWVDRVEALWADDTLDDEARIATMKLLAEERPEDDAVALYELAGAYDSAGQEEAAEPLYRRALEIGLDPDYTACAQIQFASTLRNLGRIDESLAILSEAYAHPSGTGMDDAVAAFYALALSSGGEDRRGLSIVLEALARHLPRYNRSVRGYAAELVDAPKGMPTANTAEGAKSRR